MHGSFFKYVFHQAVLVLFLGLAVFVKAEKVVEKGSEACLYEICFPKAIIEGKESLLLRGIARYRYWGFKLYIAALYSKSEQVIDDDGLILREPVQLRIRYSRDFKAKDFVESGEAFIFKNPAFDKKTMKQALEKINSLYKDIKVGDEYQINFLQSNGFELRLNGQTLGSVEGEEFARIYLGIWLSKEFGLDSDFTKKLLSSYK